MIICPECKSNEIEGVLFCSRCGTSLIGVVSLNDKVKPTGSIQTLSLDILDLNQQITLRGKRKYVLGRAIDSQPSYRLDADLNLFGGYESGVSRQHVVLKVVKGRVFVVDLNSSNRTFIDGEELLPGNEYELSPNSVLRLGKLRIKVQLL